MSISFDCGYIYDIQPYSLHDGPGIRTLVFFKGCTLKCRWCSNPESIYPYPQLRYFSETCINTCSDCISACPYNAISKTQDLLTIDRTLCSKCTENNCVIACKKNALQICGYMISADDLVEKVEKDKPFFGEEGGITLSGGEPFNQPEFAQSVLKKCKEKGISTAVESCLSVPFDNINKCLPFINFFIFDIKAVLESTHFDCCKAGNDLIKKNIQQLAKRATVPLLPRFPLIPGLTDDKENIALTSDFLKQNGFRYLNVLPYMNLGSGKYRQLGLDYELQHIRPPSKARMHEIIGLFATNGIKCI